MLVKPSYFVGNHPADLFFTEGMGIAVTKQPSIVVIANCKHWLCHAWHLNSKPNFLRRNVWRILSSFGLPISGVLCACLGIQPKDTEHLRRLKKKRQGRVRLHSLILWNKYTLNLRSQKEGKSCTLVTLPEVFPIQMTIPMAYHLCYVEGTRLEGDCTYAKAPFLLILRSLPPESHQCVPMWLYCGVDRTELWHQHQWL